MSKKKKGKRETHSVSILFPRGFTAKRYLTVRHEALVRSHLTRVRAAEQRPAGRRGGRVFKQQVHDDRTQRQTARKSHAAHANATCVLFPLYYTNVHIHYLASVRGKTERTHRACRVTRAQTNMLTHTYHSTSSATSWDHQFLSLSFFKKKKVNVSFFPQ